MNTYIDITALRLHAPIGVLERERAVGNLFEVSLRLYYDAAKAMESDDIASALNYAEVTDVVVGSMRRPCELIEHAAWRVRRDVTERFPAVKAGKVTVVKLHPPIQAPTPVVSFTLEW